MNLVILKSYESMPKKKKWSIQSKFDSKYNYFEKWYLSNSKEDFDEVVLVEVRFCDGSF